MASLIFTEQPCGDFNIAYGEPIVIQYETFNICTVPSTAYDGLLVFILGIVLFGLLAGRALAAMWLFVLGFFICAAAFLLGPTSIFSNGIAIWLNIVPGDMLVYVFLPGLLLDEALRIQFHFFKRYLVQSLVLAFLVAITSTSLLVVFMLYGLQLESLYGWTVAHAALFGAIIVATDAVSVSAILKSAGAPEHLDFMLRGESLFNDGTSLVLFSIFLTQTTNIYTLNQPFVLDWAQLVSITGNLLFVVTTGVLIGFGFGVLHSAVLQLIKRRPWAPEAELTFTLAMGYLSFYIAQVPYLIGSSGAIAVVVFGLYGAWTERYALSGQLLVSGQFDAFYTAVMFSANGIIFVYAGMATLAFLLISLPVLTPDDYDLFLFNTAWMSVAIFIAGFAFRFLCTLLLQPLFMIAGKSLNLKGVTFVTAAGLRGALSLMLLRTVILVPWVTAGGAFDQEALLIQAQMVIWGASFVFFTLVVNAPMLSPLLKLLGLDKLPEGKLRFRKKVHNMCEDEASQSFEELKAKLALTSGSRIDWGLVRRLQDVNAPIALEDLGIDPNVWYRRFGRWFSDLYTCAFCRQQPDDESIMEKSSKESSPINEDVWAPYLMSGSLLHASFMPTYAGSNVLESVKRKMKAVVTLMKFQKSSEIKAPSAAGEADTILSGIEEGKPASAMESAESTAESTVAEEIAEMEDEEDARIRLLSGLKNKIAESYAAGLISLQGLVIFNEACDTAIIDANEPLTICQKLLSTVTKSLAVKFADSSISFLHQIDDCVDISCGNSAVYKPFIRLRSDAIFDSTAVVQEYSNALLDCTSESFPQSLLQEVQKEQFQARCYIRDREVEFSGLYYVALTQRAAMSLLSDRAAYVRGLHNSGLVDDAEKEVMGTAVEQRMLELRNNGLQYRAPPPLEMIASLPFLQCIPSEQRNAILESVKRYNYEAGEIVWRPYVPVPDVEPASSVQLRLQSRAARGEIDDSDMLLVYTGVLQAASGSGSHGVLYWGQGGVIGLLSAIHAARPGGDIYGADACRDHPDVVVPKQSSIRKEWEGSQVRAFGLPKSIFVQIRKEAAKGNAVMQLAELSAFRMAAIMEFHSGTPALAGLKRQLQDAMRAVQIKPPALARPPSRSGGSFTGKAPVMPSRRLLATPSFSSSPGMLRSRTLSFSAKPTATIDDLAEEMKRTVDGQVEEIMRQITRGELKQLEEGEEMKQYDHVVVLGGSVQQMRDDESASFAAPCIAVSRERLLSDIGRQDPGEGETPKLVAGTAGAILLVLPPTFL